MKYEYKVLHLNSAGAESVLNEHGADGWDVVSFTDIPGGKVRVVIKRAVGDGLIGVE